MFAISPSLEIGSYEYLLDEKVASYKQLFELMQEKHVEHLSELVDEDAAKCYLDKVFTNLRKKK